MNLLFTLLLGSWSFQGTELQMASQKLTKISGTTTTVSKVFNSELESQICLESVHTRTKEHREPTTHTYWTCYDFSTGNYNLGPATTDFSNWKPTTTGSFYENSDPESWFFDTKELVGSFQIETRTFFQKGRTLSNKSTPYGIERLYWNHSLVVETKLNWTKLHEYN